MTLQCTLVDRSFLRTTERPAAVRAAALLSGVLFSLTAEAHTEAVGALEEVVVYGRSEQLIGNVHSASEGLVGYADIQGPPLLRVGELVESIPGMVATQHSGTGKANQFFVRGFNLDHGTDFAVSLDGVPLNLRTHGHGQGYLDLNFMIPELVEKMHYRKGTYSADVGDFSAAASAEFSLYDELPESMFSATAGEYGYRRGLIASSAPVAGGTLVGALDATSYDGPWELSEDLEQYKFYLSYAFAVASGELKVGVHGYDSSWDSTDQIPRRAVQAGLIDELGFLDPDLGGETHRYALTANLHFDTWEATAYVVDYELALFSNFTYLLENPELGDEFEQFDDRRIYGGRALSSIEREWLGMPATLRWGVEGRFDDIDEVSLYSTVARARQAARRSDSVEQLSAGGFGEVEFGVTDRLRAALGLRADYHDWQVDALREENGGSGDDSIVSPKLSLSYRLADQLETYASWGRSFHSNDVRGATISVDPATGDPLEPIDVLARADGAELGLRFEQGARFNATLVAFWLELDSELVYVGDAGTVEPNDGTERRGVELSTFWQYQDWLSLNAAYTYTDAEFKVDQGGGREIPGAIESTAVVGTNLFWGNGFSASARLRWLSDAPLIEDGSVTSDDSLLLNAGLAYRRGPLRYEFEVFNLLDSDDDDIAYYYASRLPGEPGDGVEDVHFHPLEPRALRGSITFHW